jgi:crotonobetainyl-CoA:carnitine CoA-transferase CaiB-like acyl-CoA transferase
MQWSEGAALDGVRVLDLCRVVSGPFATMQLGDLGADVVKVEEPGRGDESRSYGPPFVGGESAYFLSINRNKRSCAVDLKSDAGRDVVVRLAGAADIIIENFRPGTLDRLGLGYTILSRDNPGLILISISGFGRTGPDATRPGYDLIIQGESGVMDITGEADGPPIKVGTSIADLVTGLYGAQAALAALALRAKTGRGGCVDVSMLDAMASLLTFNAGMYFAAGKTPRRRGNAHPTIAPYETFEAADGWVNIGVANDKFWSLFCGVLGRSDIESDPRFAHAPDRAAHRAELKALLAPLIYAEPRRHWVERLGVAGIPCGEIKTVGEVCEAEQLVRRGQVRTAVHPSAGAVRYIGSAIRFNDTPARDAVRPPRLGEHTLEILSEWLDLDEAAAADLAKAGAFGMTEEGVSP